MYPELAGKVAVITGAGRRKGLGEAMARRLAAEGCKVVITDIGRPQGEHMPESAIGLSLLKLVRETRKENRKTCLIVLEGSG